MMVVGILSNCPARAVDDCLIAPNSQPPVGSHWYYHIDGAARQHCWYLGPEDRKIHHAEPEAPPAAKQMALLRTETAGDRRVASARSETPLTPPPAAIAAGAAAQAGVQEISQGARQGTLYGGPWPDTYQSAGTSDRSASTLQGVDAEEVVVRPATGTDAARHAMTIMLIRVILLVAGALAVAGIFQYTIFRIVVRRRSAYGGLGGAEQSSSSLTSERMHLSFTASRPNGLKRAPVVQFNPQDIRQILRALGSEAA